MIVVLLTQYKMLLSDTQCHLVLPLMLGSVHTMILSNPPPPHTHPGYLGMKNITRIILNDQGFSRFYKNDVPGCVSYLGPPVSDEKFGFGS